MEELLTVSLPTSVLVAFAMRKQLLNVAHVSAMSSCWKCNPSLRATRSKKGPYLS